MKHTSTKFSLTLKVVATAIFLLLVGVKTASACHGVLIVNPTGTLSPTDLTVNGSSDPATCGCGPFWMELELTCNPAGFTGTPPVPSSPLWGTQPWYHSGLNPPGVESCVLEPYFPIVVPFSQLCPGTQYYWRVREFVEGSSSASAWSGTFTFTTPGLPPAAVMVATSELLSTGNPQYSGCPGDLFQLEASVTGGCPGAVVNYTWTPSSGLSNPNIANPVCTLATNITYTVTASGGCFTITSSDDTVNITVGPPPVAGTPTAAPPGLCSGQSSLVVLTGQAAGTIQWEVSTNGVNWFTIPGATNDSLNTGPLSSSLFFHAIVTGTGWPGSGCGSSTSPPVQVVVNQSPVADAGLNTSVCSGGCTNLTGTGGVTYTWQPINLSGATVNVCPTVTTTYTLYITDANGCSDSDLVTVNISVPSVTASPSVSICSGNTTVLVASGPNGQTYSWSPSATLTGASTSNPTASPTVTTTYTVTATNSFGCTAIDSVTVLVTSAPPITVSNDTSLCNGGNAILTASGAASYTWNPGNVTGSTITVNPVTTTTYVVVGSTGNCVTSDTIVVTVAPPLTVYAGPDFDVCSGTQVTLNVGVAGGTYSWLPAGSIIGSSTTQSILAAPTGTTSFTVNVTDANGCVSQDVVTVTVNQAPVIAASSPDNSICQGQQAAILNATGGISYVWTPNISLSNPTSNSTGANPTNTTTYMVTGTDANGCSSTDTITVFVNLNPLVALTSTSSVCGGTTGQILFDVTTQGTGPFTYQIGSNTVTLPVTNLGPGNYVVNYTDANGCTGTTPVTVFSIDPQLTFTSVSTECGDSSGQILLDQTIAGVAPFTYQIGSTTFTMPITGLPAGNYPVTYTDANGCTGVVGVIVFTQNTAFVNASADPTFGSYPLPVNFGASGAPGLTNYIWTFGDNNTGTGPAPSNTYTGTGTYEVIVMAYNSVPGCAVYDTIYITVVEEATISLPNVFTPNADSKNDEFMATVSGVKEIRVEMFNRWGNMVYNGTVGGLAATPANVILWDGKASSGKVAEEGVYYYVVTAVGYDLKEYPLQGFVHLLTAGQ